MGLFRETRKVRSQPPEGYRYNRTGCISSLKPAMNVRKAGSLNMSNRCVRIMGLIGALSSAAVASDFSRSLDDASRVRFAAGQPENEPGWYVERSDNTSLRLSVLSQSRFMYSVRESGFVSTNDIQTTGFSMPRTQIALDGNIVSSQFNYRVSFDFGDAELSRGNNNGAFRAGSTGTPVLLDAYAQYNFTGKREGYYLKFGQFQNIVVAEEAIDSANQLAIDRSMISEIFGPGYTQGIALGRVLQDYAWEVSLNDGGRAFLVREADNTVFNDQDGKDLGVSGRFDWKLKGDWDQFADFTSWRGSNEAAKIGAGFHYQFSGQFNPGDLNISLFPAPVESSQHVMWTLDYQYEDDGWNFYAAYLGSWTDFEFPTGAFLPTLGFQNNAILVQGGWFITDSIEWYTRFEAFWIDKTYRNAFGQDTGYIHRIATIGATKYLLPESHAAKLSADFSYAFDTLTTLTVGSTSVTLPDPSVTGFQGLSDREFVFRVQLQLVF